MGEPIDVPSEDAAWDMLSALVHGDKYFSATPDFDFSGWQKFRIEIPITPAPATITPSVMSGIIDLQRAIYRSHALLTQDVASVQVLSDYEKEILELQVTVSAGSSLLDIDWKGVLDSISGGLVNKMDATHITICVIVIAVLYFGNSAWRAYLQKQVDTKREETNTKSIKEMLDHLKFADEKDIERMKIFAKAVAQQPKLEAINQEAEDARNSVIKSVAKLPKARIAGVELEGKVAGKLSRASRREPEETRLDGNYKILKVDTTAPDGFRVTLESLQDGSSFTASVQDALLSEDHRDVIREAEWAKKPIYAKVNARRIGKDIVEAVVVEVLPHTAPTVITNSRLSGG